jgi:hypothetical protein
LRRRPSHKPDSSRQSLRREKSKSSGRARKLRFPVIVVIFQANGIDPVQLLAIIRQQPLPMTFDVDF